MGSNLLAQLDRYWSRWQHAADEYLQEVESQGEASVTIPLHGAGRSIAYSSEVIRLSDEIFRLEKEKEELESLLQFKDRVIEVLAHDLRNPLAATSMALETLEAGMKPNTIQAAKLTEALKQRLLAHARNQVRMIDRMVSHLLQTAQGNQAVMRIQPQKTDLLEVFATVIESLRDRLQARGLVLSTDLPQDLPKVYADPDRIEQVLANLLDNAIKYTPQDGQIQIAALHRTSQKVQITICDNGPGIPLDKQKQIFEDRFRLQRDRGNANGYGLGLALCKRTISAHYGEIWVDSEPGSGSCFHFTLPVYH
jgi:two-component system clock-associated histidine kinase SasA